MTFVIAVQSITHAWPDVAITAIVAAAVVLMLWLDSRQPGDE